MAGVVYTWTDLREAAVDNAWWQNQAPRLYKQEPTVLDEARIGEVMAPSERLILSQWLQGLSCADGNYGSSVIGCEQPQLLDSLS